MHSSTATRQARSRDELRSEELVAHFAGLMRFLMPNVGRGFFQAVEELGLSLSQLKALQVLSEAEEPLSLGRLGEQLPLSLPAVSRAVDGLVRRDLVTREEDPLDRRSKRVCVTRKGRRTFEGLLALRIAGFREFLEGLEPEERRALADGLRPLARRPEIAAHVPRRYLAR